jgi:hypothetical protein
MVIKYIGIQERKFLEGNSGRVIANGGTKSEIEME